MTSTTLDLPGVYVQPRPRLAAPPRVRTDVVGFVAFEPRIRPLVASLSPGATEHRVAVGVTGFQPVPDDRDVRYRPSPPGLPGPAPGSAVRDSLAERREVRVEVADGELTLTAGAGAPLADGESRVFGIVAGLTLRPAFVLDDHRPEPAHVIVVTGAVSPAVPVTPTDDDIEAIIDADGGLPDLRAWFRLVDVHLRRIGDILLLTVRPRLGPIACEDWTDYRLRCGSNVDGMRLAETVRAFFANGGDRCHIVTVRRPFDTDTEELERARREMIGDVRDGAATATGLARLKMIEEVALAACPDLHARRSEHATIEHDLPSDADDSVFRACNVDAQPQLPASGTNILDDPLFSNPDLVYETQRDLLLASEHRTGQVHLVLTPPQHLDATTGRYRPPDANETMTWRERFANDPTLTDAVLAFGACYWPWLRRLDDSASDPYDSPPVGVAVGLIAAQDLVRGPFVSPANRNASGVVGLASRSNDDLHRRLYEPAIDALPGGRGAVNVFRATRHRGIELWGSRTLSGDQWFRHLAIRRGLSAIERRARAALIEIVFEPHTPMLQLRVTHTLINLMLDVQEAGGLRGTRPDQAFYVRCDEGINTPDDVDAGRLLCEVGVALAAPAEFFIFRLGRVDGAIEVVEP